MRTPRPIDVDRCWELFYVDSTSPTGLRNAIDRHRSPAGTRAGWVLPSGYSMAYIDGHGYSAHRIVLAMKTGVDPGPSFEADHIDRDRANNHPFNLRWANRSEQCVNKNHKRYAGVYKRGSMWGYEIRRRTAGIRIWEGGFRSQEEAFQARQQHLTRVNS